MTEGLDRKCGVGRGEGYVYIVGDSHTCVFSGEDRIHLPFPVEVGHGLPGIRSIRVGSVLAYNLVELDTRNQGRQKLFGFLGVIPPRSIVVMNFGEIDCRAHLIKQAELQKRPVAELVDECVGRYTIAIDEVREMGFRVILWGPIASTMLPHDPTLELPSYGSCKERNHVTDLYTRALKKWADTRHVPFFTVFYDLRNDEGETRGEYYLDGWHLNQKALPLLMPKLRKAVQEAESNSDE